MEKSLVQVVSSKYDGSGGKQWPARLVQQEGNFLLLEAVFQDEINHPQLGRIPRGTISLEYYWLDRWHNVFCFLQPSGALRNFYCNINLPPAFDGRTLSYIDLDLDLLVAPDGTWQILDEDEFQRNAREFAYSPELQASARAALQEVIALILFKSVRRSSRSSRYLE